MDIKTLKKELGISNQDIADMFDMSYNAYANSSAKQRYETALCRFYECVLLGGKKNETKKLTDTDHRVNDETQPLILYGVVGRSEQLKCLNVSCNKMIKISSGKYYCKKNRRKLGI